MREVLSENTTKRIKETIEIHKTSRRLLKEWRIHLIEKCRECIRENRYSRKMKCDCDVQFYLDLITELLNGNGGF